jgi:hypothetical protein
LFKNKKFQPRSLPSNSTIRLRTSEVQPIYYERGNGNVDNQDEVSDAKYSKIFSYDTVTKCLTDKCKDCTGFYRNKFIRHGFLCRCACHQSSKLVNIKRFEYSYDSAVNCSTVDVGVHRHVTPNLRTRRSMRGSVI